MRHYIKQNIFVVAGVSMIMILFELIMQWQYISFLGIGILVIILAMFIQHSWLHIFMHYMGLFLILTVLIVLRSFWLVLAVIVLLFYLFKTDEGSGLLNIEDALLIPRPQPHQYIGVRLIEPTQKQISLLSRQKLRDYYQDSSNVFVWDDINVSLIGGNHLVDLGNALIPSRESTIVITKLFGRTRVILPHDIGLRINFSTFKGNVIFENQEYDLVAENFRWESPDYGDYSRRVNLISNVAFGIIEVIII